MPTKPVQVSLDVDLLERIDTDPETLERGRSAFIRSAAESYLRLKKHRQIDTAIASAYADDAASMLGETEDLIEAQAWPDD